MKIIRKRNTFRLMLLILLSCFVIDMVYKDYIIQDRLAKQKQFNYEMNDTMNELKQQMEQQTIDNSLLTDKLDELNIKFAILQDDVQSEKNITNSLLEHYLIMNANIMMLSIAKGGIDVSFKEVEEFLAYDQTNQKGYVKSGYDCCFFARDLIQNSFNVGIKAHLIILYFDNDAAAHCIVKYYTTDKGAVFVEPMTDEISYDINIGFLWVDYKITRILEV